MTAVSFGDSVRIRASPATTQLGLAGLTGVVYGFTTPSDTAVQVVGDASKDFAFGIKIDGMGDPLWFDPDLVEFVNHSPGMTAGIGKRSFTRGVDGEWIEDADSTDDPPLP
jgi:hypothetical protein